MELTLFDSIPHEDFTWSDKEGLKSYLNSVWRQRPIIPYREEDENTRRNSSQKFFNIGENSICAGKYVGFIQYEGLRLNVYPRPFHDDPNFSAGNAIWHVLKWLSYARRIHFPFSSVQSSTMTYTNWLEALIYLFANYSEKALSTSPHFAYQEVVEEMSYVRGSIAMPQYIRDNLATGRHQYITCRHEPFLYDNLFNRIVKHTCRLLQGISGNNNNKAKLSKLLFLLDEVSDVYCTVIDCDAVKINRLYPEIDVIRNMCQMFLLNRNISEDGKGANICLLLPMEVIFEEYIGGFMEKAFGAQIQASDKFLVKTGNSFNEDVFQMRHDILFKEELIIDTKYKFRQPSEDGKSGVSQNDMYQMIAYCFRRSVSKGILLYPKKARKSIESSFYRIDSGKGGDPLYISACEIDIIGTAVEKFDEEQLKEFNKVRYLCFD